PAVRDAAGVPSAAAGPRRGRRRHPPLAQGRRAAVTTSGFQKPPTAQQAVLAELRRFIASGSLRPGQQIRQDTLSAELGVSRVPLREALKILEGEGQVTYEAHRGYFVTELSLRDL